jgi:PleD family two-component response regulator
MNMSQVDSALPLVLAVEADARQAAELLSLFETEFSAELVLASSAQQALTTLGARVPDLVLTSALIPPKDEAALTAWLRRLGDAAAHVQTVTIPALATETPAPSLGTRAFGLGRQKPAVSTPDGCDRAVFADYVSLYLDLASSERERMSSRV